MVEPLHAFPIFGIEDLEGLLVELWGGDELLHAHE